MIKIKRKKKGLTLIETLISFFILTMVLGPILGVINLSVKNNKTGEDTQKGLYAVQKCAEKFKSPDVFILPSTFKDNPTQKLINPHDGVIPTGYTYDEDIPLGYFIRVDITPVTEYNFNDGATSSNASIAYDHISYDGKIVIKKSTNEAGRVHTINLTVEDKQGNKIVPIDAKVLEKNASYILAIKNGKSDGKNDGSNGLTISLQKKGSVQPIGEWEVIAHDESKTQEQLENRSIVIQVDSNEPKESAEGLNISLDISYSNYISRNMSVYYVRSRDIASSGSYDVVKSSFNNEIGITKVYDNIYMKNNSDSLKTGYSDTRIYKISAKLFKEDQKDDGTAKPIQQVDTYKTFQQ